MSAEKNRENRQNNDVVFVDTGLIQRAMKGLLQSKKQFQSLLERAADLGYQYSKKSLEKLEGHPPRKKSFLDKLFRK